MTQREIQVLKEVYGVEHIDDIHQLRAAILEKERHLNALDKAELKMRLGRKLHEASVAAPGNRYSPESWSLSITALILLILSAVLIGWICKTNVWIGFRAVAGLMALALALGASRAVARVIYRVANGRDI